jgi:hypothetical protein
VLVISIKALELSKGGVNKVVKGVVNNVLKGAKQIATRFKAL